MDPNADDQSLLDAINEAIEDTLPEDEPVQDEPETPTESGQTEDEVNQDEEPPAEEETPEEPEEPPVEEETPEEPEEEEEETPEEPKAEEPPKEPEKPLDPINDPIPTGVAQRTRERIETLIERVKEGEQYKAERDEIVGLLQSTGASPEEFSNTIQYMRLVHSQSPDDRRKALEILRSEVQALAIDLGETNIPGFDPLEQHHDLAEAVAAKEISEQHAREIAISRLQRQRDLARQNETLLAEQSKMGHQQAVQYGVQSLNQLEQKLNSDPEWQAKYEILVPMLKPTMQNIHPSQWASVFENAYRNLKLPAPPPPPAPKAAPKTQPLRAKAPAGEGTRGISSPVDALDAALGSLGG